MEYRRSPTPLIQRADKRAPERLTKREARGIGSDSADQVQACLTCERKKCNNCFGGDYKRKTRKREKKTKGEENESCIN